MSWVETASRHKPWIFFPYSLAVLTRFFHWFRLHRFASGVRHLFGPYLQNAAHKFSSELTSLWFVFNWRLYILTTHSQLAFKTELSAYFWLESERKTYPFPLVPHMSSRFGTSVFFKSFLITVIIHPWLADLYPRPWPKSLRGQLFPLIHSLFFSSYFFFLLSPSPEVSFYFSI